MVVFPPLLSMCMPALPYLCRGICFVDLRGATAVPGSGRSRGHPEDNRFAAEKSERRRGAEEAQKKGMGSKAAAKGCRGQ